MAGVWVKQLCQARRRGLVAPLLAGFQAEIPAVVLVMGLGLSESADASLLRVSG